MNYQERKKYAQNLISQDRYPEALSEYEKLFIENPKDTENIERFGFLFNRIIDGNFELEPETADQYVMRGVAKFYKGEIERSIDDFNKALSLDKNHDYALKCRAFSLKFLERFHEAINDLTTAIKINPIGEYYDDLAEIYSLVGDFYTATKYHQKAIELSPEDARLWYNFGVELAENGEIHQAIIKFDRAIELWPDYEDAIVNRNYFLNYLENSRS